MYWYTFQFTFGVKKKMFSVTILYYTYYELFITIKNIFLEAMEAELQACIDLVYV